MEQTYVKCMSSLIKKFKIKTKEDEKIELLAKSEKTKQLLIKQNRDAKNVQDFLTN